MLAVLLRLCFFFFQAEDGIRDKLVTGVQTCALPIFRVGTDGIVTLTVDKSEMGQGSQTGLAMILAEELAADWSKVRLGPVPENPAGWSRTMRTGGSNAIRSSWEPLRKAGAPPRGEVVTPAAGGGEGDRAAVPRGERAA